MIVSGKASFPRGISLFMRKTLLEFEDGRTALLGVHHVSWETFWSIGNCWMDIHQEKRNAQRRNETEWDIATMPPSKLQMGEMIIGLGINMRLLGQLIGREQIPVGLC